MAALDRFHCNTFPFVQCEEKVFPYLFMEFRQWYPISNLFVAKDTLLYKPCYSETCPKWPPMWPHFNRGLNVCRIYIWDADKYLLKTGGLLIQIAFITGYTV